MAPDFISYKRATPGNTIPWIILIWIFLALFMSSNCRAQSIRWGELQANLHNLPFLSESGNPDDETECLLCHKTYIERFSRTRHAQVLGASNPGKLGSTCETCHGPLGGHLKKKLEEKKEPKDSKASSPELVFSFKKSPAELKSRVCLHCHESAERILQWRGSLHERLGISCDGCHSVSQRRSRSDLLSNRDAKKVCFQCHRDKRSKMMRTSHMPLREGKMNCSSCHNPHGGDGPALLNQSSINLTCFSCHQEKRGPFIWEHIPVRENCANCHDPHGSNFRPLLKQKLPFLCQQCHMQVFHPGDLYDNRKLGGTSRLGGKSCVNCHSMIHGTNHPAGAKFQR